MFTSWCCKCVNCCITSTIFCFSRSLIYSSYSCFASSVMRYQFCIYRFCVSQCLFDRITVRLICCVVIFFQQTVNFINLFRACFTFKILECYACFIITPLSICYCVIMSFCCVLLCCIPDCFSLFVCRICLFIIRFYRLCNTSSTFWANIVVCFITYVIWFCIVYFMELNIMMFMSCIFLFYTWTIFNQTTIFTSFFCKCIASTSCRYRNLWEIFIFMGTCQFRQINGIYKVCWPHELIIIVFLTSRELLILFVVRISRIVICFFKFIAVAIMIKKFCLTRDKCIISGNWNNQFITFDS